MRLYKLTMPILRPVNWYALVVMILASPHLRAQSEGLVKTDFQGITLPGSVPADEALTAAKGLADSGDNEKAAAAFRGVVHDYPRSKEAPEAQFLLAQTLQKKGDLEGAFKAYQMLLQKYPQTPKFEDSVAEEINIANAFLKGARVRVFGILTVPSMEKAEEMYTDILKVSPYSKHAAITQFNLGLAMQRQGKAQEAIAAETVRIVKTFQETGKVPNVVNIAKATPSTCALVVRHLDRPGVLAGVLDLISGARINVQEMENIVFDGAQAAVARINLETAPAPELLARIQAANPNVLELGLIKLG